jgi:hypothetical protein
MDKEYVVDGNKLLAYFMGYEYIPHNNPQDWKPGWWKRTTHPRFRYGDGRTSSMLKIDGNLYLGRNHHNLRYYNSWDWLMGVLDKLEKEGHTSAIKTTYARLNPSPCESYYHTIAWISFNSDGYNIFRCMPNDDEYDGHEEICYSKEIINKRQAVWLMLVESIKFLHPEILTKL